MTIQIIIIDDNDNLIKLVIVLNLKTYEIAKQIIIIKIVPIPVYNVYFLSISLFSMPSMTLASIMTNNK